MPRLCDKGIEAPSYSIKYFLNKEPIPTNPMRPQLVHGLVDRSQIPNLVMTFIRRVRIKKKTSSKYRVAVVVGDDFDDNLVDTVEVSLPTVEGQPIPSTNLMKLPFRLVTENGNKRYVYADLEFSDDAVNFAYDTLCTMKNKEDKPVGESFEAKIEIADDGDSRVRSARIIQTNAEEFRLRVVVIGDSENEINQINVSFADFTGPAPFPENFTLKDPINNDGKKIFKDNTLTFEEPAAAADETYYLIIELIDIYGVSRGASEYPVVVEGLLVE